MDVALLIVRIVVGLYLAAHGAQKLFGWFNGPGLRGTAGFLGGMLGFRPAGFWAPALGLAEFGGGLIMAAGLFGPLGPIAVMAGQATATLVVHWAKGPWGSEGGYEQTVTNFAVALAVAIAGVGRYSIDNALGITVPAWITAVVAVLAVLGVLAAIGTRRTQARTSPQAA